jgi:hypothetical protein
MLACGDCLFEYSSTLSDTVFSHCSHALSESCGESADYPFAAVAEPCKLDSRSSCPYASR